jgi:Sec-independent protein translocase protein TatA
MVEIQGVGSFRGEMKKFAAQMDANAKDVRRQASTMRSQGMNEMSTKRTKFQQEIDQTAKDIQEYIRRFHS